MFDRDNNEMGWELSRAMVIPKLQTSSDKMKLLTPFFPFILFFTSITQNLVCSLELHLPLNLWNLKVPVACHDVKNMPRYKTSSFAILSFLLCE